MQGKYSNEFRNFFGMETQTVSCRENNECTKTYSEHPEEENNFMDIFINLTETVNNRYKTQDAQGDPTEEEKQKIEQWNYDTSERQRETAMSQFSNPECLLKDTFQVLKMQNPGFRFC